MTRLGASIRSGPQVMAAVVTAVAAVAIGCGARDDGPVGPGRQIRSVAVLPLADSSPQSNTPYVADGLTAELTGALSRIESWRVISRASVVNYRNPATPLAVVAGELAVDALVEGTVQLSADRVRMRVRLVADGQDIWTQDYDRDNRDTLDLLAEIARSMASAIGLPVTPDEQEQLSARHPVDPEALDLYWRGRAAADLGTEEGLTTATSHYDDALKKDPGHARAHAAAAVAYGALNPAFRAPMEVMPSSREHALQAIALDDTLSEAHTALAGVLFRYDWDWTGAEREIRRAIDANPNSADAHELYGNYLTAVGRQASAIEELTRARELNPASLVTYSSLLGAYVTGRQYDEAIDESRRALAEHPDFGFAAAWLGMALMMKGDIAEALPVLERARNLDDNDTTVHFLAMAQAAAGNRAEAERLAQALVNAAETRYTCAYEVGTVFLQLGDTDKAMEWLRRGLGERADCMVWLQTEPWMDPLRVDPRYSDLVARLAFQP